MHRGYSLLKEVAAQTLRMFARPPIFRRRLSRFRLFRLFILGSSGFCLLLAILVILTATFRPSYTHPPAQYRALEQIALNDHRHGRLNPRNERIFIAASLQDRDGRLIGGQWGRSVLELIDLLGKENSFLSIYENDSGGLGMSALQEFREKVRCNSSLVSESTLKIPKPAIITLENGETTIKRIAYLAEARNRALKPLSSGQKYDKVLYLNDVYFSPIEAAQLLLATNLQPTGLSKYRAACALDFDNPFKFYDTFASRDVDGNGMGLPLYPWFSSAGSAISRNDILAQNDAVRVRSCWGGMVAFDAHLFQQPRVKTDNTVQPVRFRVEPDLYWEFSECCLIHADIAEFPAPEYTDTADTGIYMNPYIRTAYTPTTFRWLKLGRQLEYLLYPVQSLLNIIAGLPFSNDRRDIPTGQPIWKMIWVEKATEPAGGSWNWRLQPANSGGFCGVRRLAVRKPAPDAPGQQNWYYIPVPASFVEEERALSSQASG